MNVQPTHDLVDKVFEQYVAPGSPGCAVAVMQDGEVDGMRVTGTRVRNLRFARQQQ